MVTIIDLGFMFVLLPILIFSDSWKRLRRIGWEWFVFSFAAMSLFAALLQDTVFPLWFRDKNLLNLLVTRGIILVGVMAFFGIYAAVEQPVLAQGRKWRILRSVAAAFIAVVLLASTSQAVKGGHLRQSGPPTYAWLLVLGEIAFVATQLGTYACRDQEQVAAYQRQQEDQQEKQQPDSVAGSAPASAGEELKSCSQCGTKYRPSDYDSEAAVWTCSGCNRPLPRS
jgi:hypothetical protein